MTSPQLLTTDHCNAILRNILETKEWKFNEVLLERPESVEGLIGDHFKVKLKYEHAGKLECLQFFLKNVNSSSRVIRELCENLSVFEKEEHFFNVLVKNFAGENLDVSFAPKCILCEPKFILLEDLSPLGYKNVSNKNTFDLYHCEVALKALASFHASSIVYEEIKSIERGSRYVLCDEKPSCFEDKLFENTGNACSRFLNCTLLGLFAMIERLPQSEVSPDEYKMKLTDILEGLANPAETPEGRNVVLHGDLWSNNFMFKYENGKPVDGILIDYQFMKYGPPAVDVMQMIVTNTRKSVRNLHLNGFLESYYKHFESYVSKYGFNPNQILPKENFLQSCKEFELVAKFQCVIDHSMTLIINDGMEEASQSDELLEKFMYENRKDVLLASYENNELYREILQEDLIEIRDMLFKS